MPFEVFQTPEERKSLPNRGLKTSPLIYMDEKKQRDQKLWQPEAQNLWIVENKIYDLSSFIQKHPGGESWIRLTKGQDITQHFIVHHLQEEKARQILAKYYVGECKKKITRFSFEQGGLYREVKKKVLNKFSIEQIQDESTSKVYALVLLVAWIICISLAIMNHSFLMAALCAPLMIGIVGIAHNFVHHKESIFRYFFFITGFTHRQWQIMHCISHHLYPNTELDFEAAAFEPITFYLRSLPQNSIPQVILIELLFLILQPVNMTLKLVLLPIFKKTTPDLLYSFPLFIMSACIFNSQNAWEGIKLYLFIYGCFTFFLMKSLFCGHRIQDTWTQGAEKIQDYGEHTVYATSDTDAWIHGLASYILLAGFNVHVAHHFFPTADHKILPEIDKVIEQVCQKRGIKRNQKSRFQCMTSIYKGMLNRIPFSKNK